MSDEVPLSKYAAKGPRYRYAFGDCAHCVTYLDRYAVPNGRSSYIHYICRRCRDCDVILEEPRVDWKKEVRR